MPIETITKQQFEEALPVNKDTGNALWVPNGVVNGEYTYIVHPYPKKKYFIFVRSSIKEDGVSAGLGEDSIRAWIVDEDGKNWGSKSQRWVTRQRGWENRLTEMLRTLTSQISKIGPCPKCKQADVVPLIVKKDGPNKGRPFLKCSSAQCTFFEWTDQEEPKQEQVEINPMELMKNFISSLTTKAMNDPKLSDIIRSCPEYREIVKLLRNS